MRYIRQEIFSGIGKDGQGRLQAASVVIVGCGALGSLQAEALTRSGIGNITIIDRDFVELSNLQRQSLFTEEDAQRSLPKATAARDHLFKINSDIKVTPLVMDLDQENYSIVQGHNLILDGTDNFQARYLLNDIAWKYRIPWFYGACVAASGISCAFVPEDFPCLRCIFETEPAAASSPTCETAGILWPAVAAVASHQVACTLQFLAGKTSLKPELFQMDVWEKEYRMISLEKAKRPECPTCGLHSFPALRSEKASHMALCGRDAVQIKPEREIVVDLDTVQQRWEKGDRVYRNPFLLKMILPENEIILFPDGRAIIKGTTDFSRARTLYAKYVGM